MSRRQIAYGVIRRNGTTVTQVLATPGGKVSGRITRVPAPRTGSPVAGAR